MDGDAYADCTVPGCDDTGLLCGDCDDTDADVNPAAFEVCNHVDDDCDGEIDDGFSTLAGAEKITDAAGAANDHFGWRVAGIGDVTGDDVPDLVLSSPEDDTAQGIDAGSVVVISGADRSTVCRRCSTRAGRCRTPWGRVSPRSPT